MKIAIQYCGMQGMGATVKEARQDATRQIESALSADYTPCVYRYGKSCAVVWRTPFGINSAYLHGTPKPQGECMHGSQQSFDECCRSVRLNLAQLEADVESDTVPPIIAGDDKLERDYFSWLGFQRAYRFAKANIIGGNDNDWHAWACHNSQAHNPRNKAVVAAYPNGRWSGNPVAV